MTHNHPQHEASSIVAPRRAPRGLMPVSTTHNHPLYKNPAEGVGGVQPSGRAKTDGSRTIFSQIFLFLFFKNCGILCGMKPNLTHEHLTTLLHYDPDTGVFIQRLRWWNRPAGAVPGGKTPQGYWAIGIGGQQYSAHRLAWFYVHKVWPAADIDHINRNRLDNRISNLREVTRSVNLHNTKGRSSSGVKNVSKTKSGSWEARIRVNGTQHHLGSFANLEDAKNAVAIARAKFGLL